MTEMDENSKYPVLVVEDDIYLNETLCEVLESEGFKVSGVTTVPDAINELTNKKEKYLLLLLDYNLLNANGITGIELFKAAKELYPGLKAIMMSAYGSKKIKERALESGINLFIDKPFELNELVGALHSFTH